VLTASSQEKDLAESHRLRVDSYLVKPVGFLEFADVVAELGFFWGLFDKMMA